MTQENIYKLFFEAGQKCNELHPDDDSYDEIHFQNTLKIINSETLPSAPSQVKSGKVDEKENDGWEFKDRVRVEYLRFRDSSYVDFIDYLFSNYNISLKQQSVTVNK